LIIYDNGHRHEETRVLEARLEALAKSEATQTSKSVLIVVDWGNTISQDNLAAYGAGSGQSSFEAVVVYHPTELLPEESFRKSLDLAWSQIKFPKTLVASDYDGKCGVTEPSKHADVFLKGFADEMTSDLQAAIVRGQDIILSITSQPSLGLVTMLYTIRDLLLAFTRALGFLLHPEAWARVDWLSEINVPEGSDDMAPLVLAYVEEFARLGSIDVTQCKRTIQEEAGINPVTFAMDFAQQLKTIMWNKHEEVSRDRDLWLAFRPEEMYKPRAIMERLTTRTIRNMERDLYHLHVDSASRHADQPEERLTLTPRDEDVTTNGPMEVGPTMNEKVTTPEVQRPSTIASLRDLMRDVRTTLEL